MNIYENVWYNATLLTMWSVCSEYVSSIVEWDHDRESGSLMVTVQSSQTSASLTSLCSCLPSSLWSCSETMFHQSRRPTTSKLERGRSAPVSVSAIKIWSTHPNTAEEDDYPWWFLAATEALEVKMSVCLCVRVSVTLATTVLKL